jgi:hypothetical protein
MCESDPRRFRPYIVTLARATANVSKKTRGSGRGIAATAALFSMTTPLNISRANSLPSSSASAIRRPSPACAPPAAGWPEAAQRGRDVELVEPDVEQDELAIARRRDGQRLVEVADRLDPISAPCTREAPSSPYKASSTIW